MIEFHDEMSLGQYVDSIVDSYLAKGADVKIAKLSALYDIYLAYFDMVCKGTEVLSSIFSKSATSNKDVTGAETDDNLELVLLIPRDQIEAVRRYAANGGEIPKCIDLLALASALDLALSIEEVSGND